MQEAVNRGLNVLFFFFFFKWAEYRSVPVLVSLLGSQVAALVDVFLAGGCLDAASQSKKERKEKKEGVKEER